MNSAERQPPDPPDRPRIADHHRQRLGVVVDEPPPERLNRRARTGSAPAGTPDTHGCAAAGTSCPSAGTRYSRADLLGDLGHELDGARAGPDHRDPLAAQRSNEWSQRAEWKLTPSNSAKPAIAGIDGWWSCPVAITQRVRLPAPPVGSTTPSTPLDPTRTRRRRRRTRTRPRRPPRSRATAVEILEDLRLRRAQPRPVPPLRERERVQVARDVARAARVVVVMPRAAEPRSRARARSRRPKPCRRSSIAAARPPNPAPTITTLKARSPGMRPGSYATTSSPTRSSAR